ncbi:hypothetical protein BH10PSE1_BH10PSE1_13590 [soil metagenome]|jgi:hypothetical protein
MTETGYNWSIAAAGDRWTWALTDRDSGLILVSGEAPTRAVAAALVVRAIARGMTADLARSLAA